MRRGRAVGRGLIAATTLLAAAARADGPSPSDVARSRELFSEGRRFVNDGQCARALPLLAESLRLNESIGARISVADCARVAGDLVEEWRELRLAEILSAEKNDPRATYARNEASALEPRLAFVQLELPPATSALPRLDVRIDDVAVDVRLWRKAAVAVASGRHTLSASAPGKRPWTRAVEASSGVTTAVGVELEDAPAVAPAPPPPPPHADPRLAPEGPPDERRVRPAGLAVAGAGIAVVAAGVVVGLVARGDLDRSKREHCGAAVGQVDPNRCDGAGLDLRSRAGTEADVATVLVVAGAVTAVAGSVIALMPLWASKSSASRVGVRVSAGVDRVAVGGTF